MINILIILNAIALVIAVNSSVCPLNVNLISHAIRRIHSYSVTTICCLADILLLIAGGVGINAFASKTVILIINIAGIIFLSWFVINKIRGLFKRYDLIQVKDVHHSRRNSYAKALGLVFFNPLALIDTLIIIGTISSHYTGINWFNFMGGLILGDILWFFGMTIVARFFSKQLNRVRVWIALDIFTIIIISIIIYKIALFL